jgi:transposase-like protein
MASRSFSQEQKNKLIHLFNEGVAVMQEIEDLNGGLSDTISAIAEELEIKPAVLKKAVKIAQKSTFTKISQDNETIQDILETVGRTL